MFTKVLVRNRLACFHRRYFSQLPQPKASEMIPTHSRLRANFIDWHKTYDTTVKGPLSSTQIEEYYTNGYLLIPDLIPDVSIDDCLSDIEQLVDNLAQDMFDNQLITDLCSDCNVFTKLSALEKQYSGSGVLIHKAGILQQSFIDIWQSKQLTDIAGQLLQPSPNMPIIDAHPVWNLRSKIPTNEESTVPWHQDLAYLDESAWNTHILTAWVPMLDIENIHGPLQLLKSGHLPGNIATHTCCAGNTWYLDLAESILKKEILEYIPGMNENNDISDMVLTFEMKRGSVLFFNNVIPHRSLDNFSEKVRWSLDLRWQKHGLVSGFDDLKSCLKLRDFSDDDFKPDWKEWALVDRNQLQLQLMSTDEKVEERFKPLIGGPWMDQWEIVKHNKHTSNYFNDRKLSWH